MIVNDLQKRIMNEEFEENHKLPTEEKLIEEYKVSRNTIRNAIKILINDIQSIILIKLHVLKNI